jgi:hypothetical protein
MDFTATRGHSGNASGAATSQQQLKELGLVDICTTRRSIASDTSARKHAVRLATMGSRSSRSRLQKRLSCPKISRVPSSRLCNECPLGGARSSASGCRAVALKLTLRPSSEYQRRGLRGISRWRSRWRMRELLPLAPLPIHRLQFSPHTWRPTASMTNFSKSAWRLVIE